MALPTGNWSCAKSAFAFCSTTGFALTGSPSGAAVTRNSLSTKLPLGARPGPCAGSFGSGNTSRRMPVMPVTLVLAVTV